MASGTFRRNFPSYGIAIVKGKNIIARADSDRFVFGFPGIAGSNTLSVSKIDPWGVLVSDKIKFVAKIEFPEPEWKQKQGAPPARRPREWDGTLLRKYENWLKDGNLRELLSVEDTNIETLFSLYQPWSVEELMVMVSVISSYGGKIMPLLENKLKNSSISEKAVMISHLSYLSAEQSLPVIRHLLEDNDPRIKISALRALGGIYSNDEGLDPGRTFLIQSFMKFIDSGENIIEGTELEKQWINYFSQTYLSDVFSFLSMSDDFKTSHKLEFYNIMPDVFSPINNNLKRYFLNYMLKKKEIYYGIFSKELNVIKSNRKYFERKVRMMLKDAHPGVKFQAITCLGEMRSKKAIFSIADFLNDERYQIREAAINSIAKFGQESMPVLKKKFKTADARTRALILSAVFHSWDIRMLELIDLGLNNESDFVNMTAISAARSLKPPLSAGKDAYMENIRKKFSEEVNTE
ncbi:MAG: HEAT repeat protein [Elusimicrobia bacterium ADurb.Bin231]|nr:MAG: HEAT repeat protein [Elusimicrobia bacterium ADurb.Bin231]